MSTRLCWKKIPRQSGLGGIGSGPQGHVLHDSGKVYARAYPSGGDWRGPLRGWYWVSGWDSGVPHKNTCDELVATAEQAKADALAYVKQNLGGRVTFLARMKDNLLRRYADAMECEIATIDPEIATFLAGIEGDQVQLVLTGQDAFEVNDDNIWLPDAIWDRVEPQDPQDHG